MTRAQTLAGELFGHEVLLSPEQRAAELAYHQACRDVVRALPGDNRALLAALGLDSE